MDKIKQIKTEIERRNAKYKEILAKVDKNDDGWVDSVTILEAKIITLEDLLNWLESLQEEPINKQSVEEAMAEVEKKAKAFTDAHKGESAEQLLAEMRGEQKPVWNEDDEQYLLVCKNALTKYQNTDKWDAHIISNWLENKLKSLRPQSQWKPSDEQMEALANALSLAKNCGEESAFDLRTLHEQLKKLWEE